tara:strand:+ start:956 stop:1291 length:336 start_codon:yes stop_codon:yes gene_type:complete
MIKLSNKTIILISILFFLVIFILHYFKQSNLVIIKPLKENISNKKAECSDGEKTQLKSINKESKSLLPNINRMNKKIMDLTKKSKSKYSNIESTSSKLDYETKRMDDSKND